MRGRVTTTVRQGAGVAVTTKPSAIKLFIRASTQPTGSAALGTGELRTVRQGTATGTEIGKGVGLGTGAVADGVSGTGEEVARDGVTTATHGRPIKRGVIATTTPTAVVKGSC